MPIKNLFLSFKIGWFLVVRQIRHSRMGTTFLIIFIMMMTFINFIVIKGFLVGLADSAMDIYRERYHSDIILSNLSNKYFIENSPQIENTITNMPWTVAYSSRYVHLGTVEGTYKQRENYNDKPNSTTISIAGINPRKEELTTELSRNLVSGTYLSEDDNDYLLIGANLLNNYSPIQLPGISMLSDVDVGSKVRVTIGNNTKEMTVKGVLSSKVGDVDQRVYVTQKTMRELMGKVDYNVGEISIKIAPGTDPKMVQLALKKAGIGRFAKIQTSYEALPKWVKDVAATFSYVGDLMGSISIVVAFITIFIVIYINAISRRKYIAILKAIGIHATAIEIAYMLQSLFYAVIGTSLGMLVLYFFIIPYLNNHPINFPFSDGIVVAPYSGTLLRAGWLIVVTVIAGYIPARLVVKQNTLEAILGK